jgi:signal transduction histidine kinase
VVALFGAAVLTALLTVGGLSLAGIISTTRIVTRSREVQAAVSRARGALVDAAAGQRGFLLTGDASYLEPVDGARATVTSGLADAKRLTTSDPVQQAELNQLEKVAGLTMDELELTIDLYRRGEKAAATAVVRTNRGKRLMDEARRLIAHLRSHEDEQLNRLTNQARRRLDLATWIDLAAGLGLIALGFALFLINRDLARREVLESALQEETTFQQRLIAILGHDLRNPLTAISMAAGMVSRKGGLAPSQAEGMDRISASAARMERMIKQLLDMTRARTAGGLAVEARPGTDVAGVAANVVDELRAAHPEAEVTLESDGVVPGVCDADRMAQVISNLVANAIVHGRGPVSVRVARQAGGAVVAVHNAGTPIPAEVLPHLFEPFHRARRGHSPRARGLGLGLFIADRIVRAHGGSIEVRSGNDSGTTVTVTIPSRPEPPPATPSQAAAARQQLVRNTVIGRDPN